MKLIRIFVFLTMIGFTASCQTFDSIQDDIQGVAEGRVPMATGAVSGEAEGLLASPCPQVEIVDDLSSLSDFMNPNETQKANLVSRIDLKSAESACKLASKSAIVDLKLVFQGTLGNKGRASSSDKPFFSYPFFVAVTAPNGKILAKEVFAASMTYASAQDTHTYYEKMRQIIPIKSKEMARYYKILIGFQVTPDQLAYNRKHMVPVKK